MTRTASDESAEAKALESAAQERVDRRNATHDALRHQQLRDELAEKRRVGAAMKSVAEKGKRNAGRKHKRKVVASDTEDDGEGAERGELDILGSATSGSDDGDYSGGEDDSDDSDEDSEHDCDDSGGEDDSDDSDEDNEDDCDDSGGEDDSDDSNNSDGTGAVETAHSASPLTSSDDSPTTAAAPDVGSPKPSRAVKSKWRLKWDKRTPVPGGTIELRVHAKPYFFFKGYTLKDVKDLRPCGDGLKRADQKQMKAALDAFYEQPYQWDGDNHVVVSETYKTSAKGFPGDLCSGSGCQTLYRAIRSHLLGETADLDMKVAMPTILLWVCKQFGIATPQLEYYVNHREDVLKEFMRDTDCTRPYAKEYFNMPWTWDKRVKCPKSKFHTKYDEEAKEIQDQLMAVPELQWILPFCKAEENNQKGSFISLLFHFVQPQLLGRVAHLIQHEKGEKVACLVFDGLNVANPARHGDEPLLARASEVCEEVCPGINMGWAWKTLDYEVRTKDKKKRVPDRADIKGPIVNGNLTIPQSFEPPTQEEDEGDDKMALDPNYEPSYETLRQEFSLPSGRHGKVGADFIEVVDEDDTDGRGMTVKLWGQDKFVTAHKELMYYEINDNGEKKSHSFIQKWLTDPRMNARYLRDPSQRYQWDYLDMHPDPAKCPPNCYNLWRGFNAETLAPEVDLDALEPEVQAKLDCLLGHVRMLCALDGPAHEEFLFDWLAHTVQYPNRKFGVMSCMVGKRGVGKTSLWEIIAKMLGKHVCFEATEPQRDVFGDNNDNMRTAFMVRIVEGNKKQFQGHMGKMRNLITDSRIRPL